MRRIFTVLVIMLAFSTLKAQDNQYYYEGSKGNFFLTVGLNRSYIHESTMELNQIQGVDTSNFEIMGIDQQDNPGSTDFEEVSDLQYSFKVGFYVGKKTSLSIGLDHLTSRLQAEQSVKLDGYINASVPVYGGTRYNNEGYFPIDTAALINKTSSSNYLSVNFDVYDHFIYGKGGKNAWGFFGGIGAGVLFTENTVRFLGSDSYTESGFGGFGLHANIGTRFYFIKNIFIEAGAKLGYLSTSNESFVDDNRVEIKNNYFHATGNLSLGFQF